MVPGPGLEPGYSAPKADVLPIRRSRNSCKNFSRKTREHGKRRRSARVPAEPVYRAFLTPGTPRESREKNQPCRVFNVFLAPLPAHTISKAALGNNLPCRILIVDDHALMRKALKSVLEKHEDWHVCGEAADGLDAVRKAADLRPDLVVLDLAMPKMDGIQSARLISVGSPNVPILMHTWHVSRFVSEQAEKNGICKIVGKGVGPQELLETVEALLRNRAERKREGR